MDTIKDITRWGGEAELEEAPEAVSATEQLEKGLWL